MKELPDSVIIRAAADPLFAHHLYVINGNEGLLKLLIQTQQADVVLPPSKDAIDLVLSSMKSLIKWGNEGFKLVSQDIYEKRWSACQSCENLVSSGSKAIYKVAKKLMNLDDSQKICSLCGCVAISKTKLPSEKCPARSTSNPAHSKWDEPI